MCALTLVVIFREQKQGLIFAPGCRLSFQVIWENATLLVRLLVFVLAKDSNLSKSANFKAVAMQILYYMKNLKLFHFNNEAAGLLKKSFLKQFQKRAVEGFGNR